MSGASAGPRERTTARSRGARQRADIGGEPRKTALLRGEGGWDSPPRVSEAQKLLAVSLEGSVG